jgi:hypothetical protein
MTVDTITAPLLAGSAIPAVKARVVELLLEAEWPALRTPYSTGLPRPSIEYSADPTQTRDRVIIGDTSGEPGDQTWFTFLPSRLEAFELQAAIVSEAPGLSAADSTERAFAMFTVFARTLMNAVRPVDRDGETTTDFGIDLVSIACRQPTHTDVRTAEGYTCVIDTGIAVQAWVAP